MIYLVRTSLLMMTVVLTVTSCAKKSKSRRGAPAAAATPTAGPGTSQVPEPTGEEDEEKATPRASKESSRMGEAERRRFDRSGYKPGKDASDDNDDDDGDEVDKNKGRPHDDTPEPSEEAGPEDANCPMVHEANSVLWAPGLPNPPSEVRICTGGTDEKPKPGEKFVCAGNPKPVYTDARQDGLMATVLKLVNDLPDYLDEGSRDLARGISDVRLSVTRRGARVRFKLHVSAQKEPEFEFRGAGSPRANAVMHMIATQANPYNLSAALICADSDGSCHNAILRLQQNARSGRVAKVAYVIVRSGEAHVTISEKDRTGFGSIQNKAYADFAQYLSNTSYNTCVDTLREVLKGNLKVRKCKLKRLKEICGRSATRKQPGADAFYFQSWSVAYGPSRFVFQMVDKERSRFSLEAPLIASNEPPMLNEHLHPTGTFGEGIEDVLLVANDGGGNLNLQINFKGGGEVHTRISVTTMIENVRFNADQLTARAKQLLSLEPSEFITKPEWQEQAQARAARRAAREGGAPAPENRVGGSDPRKMIVDPKKTVVDPKKTAVDPKKTVVDSNKTVEAPKKSPVPLKRPVEDPHKDKAGGQEAKPRPATNNQATPRPPDPRNR